MDRLPRVTPATLDVLEALVWARDDLHGFAIARAVKRPTGSVYPILSRLEHAGLLESRWEFEHPEPGRPRRRFYHLSPDGLSIARELLEERRGKSHKLRRSFPTWVQPLKEPR